MDRLNPQNGPYQKLSRPLYEGLLQGLLLTALLVLLFPGFFFQHEVIAPTDLLLDSRPWNAYLPDGPPRSHNRLMTDTVCFFIPNYTAVQEALLQGVWPLWNPDEFAGMPLLANMQSSVFYPLRLSLVFFDLPTAYSLSILLKLWICGMIAFVVARGFGLGGVVAAFFSVTWMLSTYCLTWAYWPLTDVAGWVPLALLGVEWLLLGRLRRGGILLALGGAMMLLAGHPETAFAFSFGLGMYFAMRIFWGGIHGGPVIRPTLAALAAWIVAIMVCAVQLGPFVEYLLNSATFYDREKLGSLAYYFSDLVSLWVPRYFGTFYDDNYWGSTNSNLGDSLYHGMATLILLALLPAVWPRKKPGEDAAEGLFRMRAACLGLTSLFGFLLAFDLPTLQFVHRLPVLNSMLKVYHAVFSCLALPLLAALILERWSRAKPSWRALLWVLPVAAVATLLLVGVYRFNEPVLKAREWDAYVRQQMMTAAILAGLGCLFVAVQCFGPRKLLVPALLTLMAAGDLIYAQRGLQPTSPVSTFYPKTALTRHLQSLGHPCRIGLAEGLVPAGLLMPYGIEDWSAYDGLYPGRMWRFQWKLRERIWNNMITAAAIPYFLNDPRMTDTPIPQETYVKMERTTLLNGLEVMRYPLALPHARLVGKAEIIPDMPAMFERMSDVNFAPRDIALLEKDPGFALPDTPGPAGAATITEYEHTRVSVVADAERPCLLVLADAWYPGWQADVDGAPAQVLPAYSVFRAVMLSPGKHEITFTYRPASFFWGLCVSIGTLLALTAAGAVLLFRIGRAHTPAHNSTAEPHNHDGSQEEH